ncbi:MAG: HAD family phosphatase [Anaerovibrio sp.]|uniref:Cof-type HAD-IIB family hydrolase n=1 Tax=Anaerovibrio sp. TaxID=1872532 RepID=UPI0025C2E9B6|nr:Cof-type HAD-IIB family hydrolase [Anaerovibrio sp.]MBE6099874.1 HAD family phosphatase [Anaerovibrio sp.]
MKAKLFVTDMDGTLLNSQRKITDKVKLAIKKAVEAGVIFTVATGRMHISALPYVQELGIDVPVITYNGALIKYASGDEVFASYLDKQLVQSLVDYAHGQNIYIQLYSDDKLYYYQENELSKFYQTAAGVIGHPVGDALDKYMDKVPKLLLIGRTPEEADRAVRDIAAKFSGQIVAVKSTPIYVELIKPGINKASAIAKMAEIYKVPAEAILAIGDSNNDITMLQAAHYGVAMGNANADVKKVAKYQVADCDHDGIAEAIERFCF